MNPGAWGRMTVSASSTLVKQAAPKGRGSPKAWNRSQMETVPLNQCSSDSPSASARATGSRAPRSPVASPWNSTRNRPATGPGRKRSSHS